MLTTLRIADFAILEAAELHLGPGLTAVTGETGAGKSILIDALAVVLGARTSDRVVRHGRDLAEIEAQFEEITDPAVHALLEDLGLPPGDEALVLRRTIGRGAGKSRCYVNGRLITAAQLKAIAAPLVDLSSQHAQHRLLDRDTHLQVLDRFAGHLDLRRRYAELHAAWRQVRAELDGLEQRQRERADRMDYLKFVHDELAALKVRPGEHAELQQKVQRIKAAEQLAKAAGEATGLLTDDGGVRDLASRAARALGRLGQLDGKAAELAERAREIEALAGELGHDVASWARHLDRDDRQLATLAERLDALNRAFRKHGGSEEALLERQRAVAEELDADTTDLRLSELRKDLDRRAKQLRDLAEELGARRAVAAGPLGNRIAEVVRLLGMPSAAVRVDLRPTAELGPFGSDSCAFWLRANAGEAEGPLQEVASGGELSRVLLAIQRACTEAVQGHGTLERGAGVAPTCVYDEADAGLSGSTGLVLGRFLSEVAGRQQVLCISHLPQVAAAADNHVRVTKQELGGRTRSVPAILDEAERVAELARMLGTVEGEGDTALAHARQLLLQQRRTS